MGKAKNHSNCSHANDHHNHHQDRNNHERHTTDHQSQSPQKADKHAHFHQAKSRVLSSYRGGPGLSFYPVALLLFKLFVGRFVFTLKSITEVPPHMQFNQFIHNHYRVGYRKRDCIRSIFRLHNETFNIHTHLIGAVIFIYIAKRTIDWLSCIHEGASVHTIVLLSYLAAVIFCLVASTAYHVFGCHSECAFERLLSVDYSGINALIFGSQLPICFYLFYDQPLWMWFHIVSLIAVTLTSSAITQSERFQDDYFRNVRIAAFVGNAMYGLFALLHLIFQQGVFSEHLQSLMWHVLAMYLSYGSGIVIYAFRIPERFSPGSFDLLLHSHQIWHCLVVAAALFQYRAILALYYMRSPLALKLPCA